MAKQPFLERLKQKPLLGDGAMGTMLHQSGVKLGHSFDSINVTDPSLVASIHRQYIESGAELIETNTFSANDFKLSKLGLQNQTIEINEAGVELAKRVIEDLGCKDRVYLSGSVGPLGSWIAPIGRITEEKAYAAFYKQIATLIFAGVEVIQLETFSDVNEIAIAARAARDVKADIPIIATLTFNRDDRTLLGDTAVMVAEELRKTGADVIGVNCSVGPAQLLRLTSIIRSIAPDKHLLVSPNAGWPEQIGGRVVYPATPEYFGEYALAFAEAGAAVIGGCCGTTPAHIKSMREALDDEARPTSTLVVVPKQEGLVIEPPIEQPTQLVQKLRAGEFITTVEVAPPRGSTAERIVAVVEMLHDAGVNFIDVSDSPLARMRMSPWAVAYLIQQQVGIETVLHFPVRGRNLLRVQGDLLAAHAMNIRNIFVTMGDPTKIGDYPQAFDTHDVVPTSLIRMIHEQFNNGLDYAGNGLGRSTNFTVAAALNLAPTDLEKELALTRKKVESVRAAQNR
jgi:homocysteine S-methyltransferase